MKKFRFFFFFSFSIFCAQAALAQTEGTMVEKQPVNFISMNLGQYLVNEINLGYEHFLSEKNSIEVNGGIIYRNEFWLNLADEWFNSQYFREHGFAARVYYKVYKKTSEKNNYKSFYSFGLNYQYLYFNDEWVETGKLITLNYGGDKVVAEEEILMHRLRHRIGAQLFLGNVIPAGNNFALEFYYGLGVRAIYSNRFDVARGGTVNGEKVVQKELNFEDENFYLRPTIHAGVKLKLGW